MQFVDRSVLEDLLRSQGEVTEAARKSFSYDEFLEAYTLEMETAKREAATRADDLVAMTYKKLKKQWLKGHCPPIRYIDEGSSRAAYACSGGKCLKIATKLKGVAQNRQEVQNVGLTSVQKYSCFAQNYAYDSTQFGSILTECCAELKTMDLRKLYGMRYGISQLYKVFDTLRDSHFDLKQAISDQYVQLKEMKASVSSGEGEYEVYDVEIAESIVVALSMMLKSNEPKWKVLKDLNQFYVDHGKNDEELIVDDLNMIENWGLAIRDKQLVPVVIDAGYSEKVFQQYYSRSAR